MPLLRSVGFALASLGLVLSTMVHVASFFAVEFRAAIAPLFFGATVVFLNFLGHFGALVFVARAHAPGGTPLAGYEARMFSAGLMTFYLLCTLAWWTWQPGTRPTT